MKTLTVLLLLLFGALFLWQGPVVADFFKKRVQVTTPEERAAAREAAENREIMARQEAEARAVENEIVRLAGEIDGKSTAKGSEMRPPAGDSAAPAINETGMSPPGAKGRRAPKKGVLSQPM